MTSSDELTKTEFYISMAPNSLTPFLCLPSGLQYCGGCRGRGRRSYQHIKFRDFVTIKTRREAGLGGVWGLGWGFGHRPFST